MTRIPSTRDFTTPCDITRDRIAAARYETTAGLRKEAAKWREKLSKMKLTK